MEIIKKQNYATKISTILFLLIPFLYFTGPFLSDLTIVVIILLFLLKFKNNYIKKNKNLIILTLIFSVYLFLNHILLNEFDKNLNMIKGGGGALLQEKIIASHFGV